MQQNPKLPTQDVSEQFAKETVEFKRFCDLLPNVHVQRIKQSKIPKNLIDFMILLMDPSKEELNNKMPSFSVESQDRFGIPVKTYLISVPNLEEGADSLSRGVYLGDVINHQPVGRSKMIYAPSDIMGETEGNPTVATTYTETSGKEENNFRKRGLYTRRLEIMNAFALAHFNKPLQSDITPEPLAYSVWDRLVKLGKARQIRTPFGARFVFNVASDTIPK